MPFKKEEHYVFNSFGRREVVTVKVPVMSRQDHFNRRWMRRKIEQRTGHLEYVDNKLMVVANDETKNRKPVKLGNRDKICITDPNNENFLLKGEVYLGGKQKSEEMIFVVDTEASSPQQEFPLMTIEMLTPYFETHNARVKHVILPPTSRLPKLK